MPSEGIKDHKVFTKFVEYGNISLSFGSEELPKTVGGLPLFYERAYVSALLVFNKGGRYDVHNCNRIIFVRKFNYIINLSYCFNLRT